MSTNVPGVCHLSGFLHHFVLAKLTTSSIGLKLLLNFVVCIHYTFDKSFGIENNFTNKLKESCR